MAGGPLSLRPDRGESDAARRVAGIYLARFSRPASARSRDVEAAVAENPLDGLVRPKALRIVQHAIQSVNTSGVFRDEHWAPIQAIWKALEREGMPFAINRSQYESDPGSNVPVRKVWEVWVPFTNAKGRADNIYVRIVAAGAGPVADPLDVYDVTAYAS